MPPADRDRSGDAIWSDDQIWSPAASESIRPCSIPLASARALLPGMQATDSVANFRLELYSARMEPRRSRRAAWMCSNNSSQGPAVCMPIPAPPSLNSSSSRLLSSALCCIGLLCGNCHGLDALHRLFVSQPGGFVGLGRVAASDRCVLNTSVVCASVPLQRGRAVALGGSLMMVRCGSMGILGHKCDPLQTCCVWPCQCTSVPIPVRARPESLAIDTSTGLRGPHPMRDSHRFPIARAMRHLAFLVKEIEALDRKSPEASAVRTWPSPINSCTPREIRTTLAQKTASSEPESFPILSGRGWAVLYA